MRLKLVLAAVMACFALAGVALAKAPEMTEFEAGYLSTRFAQKFCDPRAGCTPHLEKCERANEGKSRRRVSCAIELLYTESHPQISCTMRLHWGVARHPDGTYHTKLTKHGPLHCVPK